MRDLVMQPHALDSITVKGFKSIRSIEDLKIRPVNLLIGANGSGKSNFLGAFSLLNAGQEDRLEQFVAEAGGADRILHFGTKVTPAISLALSFFDGTSYTTSFMATAQDDLIPTSRLKLPDGPEYPEARKRLAGMRLFHVHDTSSSSPMRKTARKDDNRRLRPDASNLAAFLYLLRQRYADSYRQLEATIRSVAPFFDGFLLEPLKLNPEDLKLEWRHRGSDRYFDASSFSDGTLRFAALATLFLQPLEFRPSLILVDEPELGLHPAALELLSALIQQASLESQVIVSTQSSRLLDYFEPEDVLVADREDGATRIKRLHNSDLAEWLDEYSLGELWEKNEFGGRPHKD